MYAHNAQAGMGTCPHTHTYAHPQNEKKKEKNQPWTNEKCLNYFLTKY